jgi:OTT_1508-like deaminase
MPTVLTDMATAIVNALDGSERSIAATTIAVCSRADGTFNCASNDVNKVTSAEAMATQQGVTARHGDLIRQAGIGMHAEMWLIQDMLAEGVALGKVKDAMTGMGSSRPSCKYCSQVMQRLGINIESPSTDLYKSWYNPITTKDDGTSRDDFRGNQRLATPDWRQNSTDYWFTDTKPFWTKTPQGN